MAIWAILSMRPHGSFVRGGITESRPIITSCAIAWLRFYDAAVPRAPQIRRLFIRSDNNLCPSSVNDYNSAPRPPVL